MPDSPERLVQRLRDEGQKTLEFFNSLEPGQWEQTIYSGTSNWTARQLLAHFVATERAIQQLIKNVLAGGPGAPERFDIDAYNERKVTALRDASLGELLHQFASLRQSSVDLVGRMVPGDLQKTGRHPFLGETALEDIIKLLYRHNQIHQRDVRKMLVSGQNQLIG